jgi:signal transduction histidine kinase
MSSAPDGRLTRHLARLPIRLRLATSVAAVAFVILVAFAVIIGQISAHRLRSTFNAEVQANANQLRGMHFTLSEVNGKPTINPPISDVIPNAGAVVRFLSLDGSRVLAASSDVNLGNPVAEDAITDFNGYRVINMQLNFFGGSGGFAQYAQPLSTVNSEIGWLELMLLLGALVGTVLAFGAGSLVARRSIAPVAALTAAAEEIERTRDPNTILPEPIADDEVAELSRTLTRMLTSLSDAREETEAMLERQREFVADASHELRTPLTSVLANLELLVDSLHGADREAAESALRSTQRMRRLVGDLLLLARADAAQSPFREPLDLGDVVVEAASELGPAAAAHAIELDVRPTPLLGARDDLQRVATNLIENALRHTPPGTRITASTRSLADGGAELVVADDGPGIDPDARATLFERFVRGAGDRGGSFGLGLAIVAAVAQAHGGTVAVDTSPHGGARFTVRLPVVEASGEPVAEPLAAEPA